MNGDGKCGIDMRRFSGVLGVQQGTLVLFSDFADDGPMWAGSGPREVRRHHSFDPPFQSPPVVMVGVSMWDMDHKTNMRADLTADNVTAKGFDLVFRTWGDSRVARIRADWTALGSVADDEVWEI